MSTRSNDCDARRTRLQAAAWHADLQAPEPSPALWDGFGEWTEQPENAAAFERIAGLVERARQLPRPAMPSEAELAADRYDGSVPVDTWLTERTTECASKETSPAQPDRWRARWFIAAGLAALILVAVSVSVSVWISTADQTIETRAGERQTWTLSDDTGVTVGSRTVLTIKFEGEVRLVYLARGEAVFDVAKDPARPFVVRTDFGEVRAVGTRFAVSSIARELDVIVAEGEVAVSFAGRRQQVRANQQLQVIGPMGSLRSVDARSELESIATGMIDFPSIPIAEAIEAFNARSKVQIEIERVPQPSYVAGRFSIDHPESLATFIAQTYYSPQGKVVRVRPDLLLVVPVSEPGLSPEPSPIQ